MGIIDKIKEGINKIKEEGEVLAGNKSKDSYFSSKREFSDEASAIQAYQSAKEKLFDVNTWNKIPAIATASFSLYDSTGFPLAIKKPRLDDFIKIVLPGPFPENWVKVVEIKEEENCAEFTVKPSHDPTTLADKSIVKHFFSPEASSTFRVEREEKGLIASEIGQDEVINNEGTEGGERKALNTLISVGGWAGFQKYQWKNLTDFLVGIQGEVEK